MSMLSRSVPGAGLDVISERAISKAKWRLMPLILLLYFIAFVDRVNVSFAALTMNKDLGLTPVTYGWGAGIFFIGYVLFEVPSNWALVRVGARRWIARIMFSWGLASMLMAASRGPVTFLVFRFLLGAAEAGFAPGIVYYMMSWFPSKERANVVSIYYLGVPLATIIAGPLSGLILDHLNGWAGLRGWQWLFLSEGFPAIVASFIALRFLTNSPQEANWLDEEERTSLVTLLNRDQDRSAGHGHAHFGAALRDRSVWLLSFAYIFIVMGLYGFGFWMPIIIQRFGFSNTAVGFISAIPYLIGAFVMYFWARHSDRTRERRWHFTIASLALAIGLASAVAPVHAIAFAGIVLSAAGVLSAVPVFFTIPAAFLKGPAAAGGLALVNATGNVGGFFAPIVVGWIAQRTGNPASGLLFVAAAVILAPFIILSLDRKKISEAE
ncbi:MAG: MFS transporter [Verrucomicrobia bacterium]|nr:MFS transporter [Verrucomicrobiota bacterium]